MFVPFTTDEMEYDDIYVNNNFKQLYLKRKPQLAAKVVNVPDELDFVSNSNQTRIAKNYGTYDKKYEADQFLNLISDCDTDRDFIKRGNLNDWTNLKAIKII